jgi:hypothetical protein
MARRQQPRGKDGRWVKVGAGGFVGAALLAGLMTSVGGGDATESIGAALDSAASSSSVSEADTLRARDDAEKGDESESWRRLRLKQLRKDLKREFRCAAQSTREVQRFFLAHPCRKLDQRLFLWSDADGNLLVGSVVWVTMPSAKDAARFRTVEGRYGSGDVTPVGTDILEVGGIRFTGQHYESRRDGKLVVIAETEPVRGRPSDTYLKQVADVVDALPRP